MSGTEACLTRLAIYFVLDEEGEENCEMERTIDATPAAESILHGALELSKNTWLLGIQFPDRPQPSLYPIRGGNTEDLRAKLTAARIGAPN